MTHLYRFRKTERLKSRKAIDELFKEGHAFNYQPLRVVHLKKDTDADKGIKVLISVPKRKLRKSTDRNYIKRLIREAYRLGKTNFSQQINSSFTLHIGLIYIGTDTNTTLSEISESIHAILEKLQKIYVKE